MAETPREFFEELRTRVDPETTRGKRASYRFDVEGAGSWHVDVDDGSLSIDESDADAECVIAMDESTFMRIVRGEQSPTSAYMTGKVKVKGDVGLAMRLRELFG